MGVETSLSDFFEVDDFAVSATYAPLAGGTSTVLGIFDAPQASRNASDLLDVTLPAPQFVCATADVPGATEGDSITISAVDYTVRVVLSDGTGVTTLILERD